MPGVFVLPLSGCLLARPLAAFANARYEVRTPIGFGPAKYTLGEMIQFIRILRGDLTVPPQLDVLAGLPAKFEPPPAARGLAEVDVVLVEPNSPDEILYGSYVLQRPAIVREMIRPIVAASKDPNVGEMAQAWYAEGVLRRDEEIRVSLGPQLGALVPDDLPAADLYRDVFLNARGELGNVIEGVRELRALVEKPIGLITYTYRYLPNGRPIHWPADFRENILNAAVVLDLPVFEPWKLVRELGVEKTMAPDMRRYRADFDLPLGEVIVNFAKDVASRMTPVAHSAATHTQTTPSRKRRKPPPARLAEAVNNALVSVHKDRLNGLGEKESGVFGAYRAGIEQGVLIGSREKTAVELICDTLEPYDEYAVLRAGLGEVALLLAARGRRVTVYEPNRFTRYSLEAGKAALETAGLLRGKLFTIEWSLTPYGPLDGRVLAVGLNATMARDDASALALLEKMRVFEALLIMPRFFVRPHPTDEDRALLADRLLGLGFTIRKDFSGTPFCWFGKPEIGNAAAPA